MAKIEINYAGPTIFSLHVPVRITDLNYGNHLGHDTLVSLLHEARARFFRENKMEEGDVDGAGVILTDLAVTYKSQVYYGQVLRIEIAIGETASRGCTFLYRVTDRESGKLAALARTGMLFFDYQENRVVKIPQRFLCLIDSSKDDAGQEG